ncbi:MAG: GGDEF domain-containing protein [Pseudomonadota bacterium]
MSQQGPILFVSDTERLPLAVALEDCKLFPLIDSTWADACDAVERLQPAAIIADLSAADEMSVAALAAKAAAVTPYLPMIGIDPAAALPSNVLSYSSERGFDRLLARLNAALRVRTLHATIERRLNDESAAGVRIPQTDLLDDATVLLVGRGASYPSLSVALGERVAVVGALSLEAAVKHLEARDLDGVVIGSGFSARVLDNFFTALSDDARFRHLPVIVSGIAPDAMPGHLLPNLEVGTGDAAAIAAAALPLIRQHALDARLTRTLKSIESGGLLDPRTGLMTGTAFEREFSAAITDSTSRGAGLSAARFMFDQSSERAHYDAARILSRLMRRFDFATMENDGSIVAAFAETDLREAHVIARRIASVVKHTMHAARREAPADPHVSIATLLAKDTPDSLMARLKGNDHRAAS